MDTFHNKQALYGIFQYVLTTTNHRKTASLSQNYYAVACN